MHVEATLRAVEREVLELPLEIGLHVQAFEPEHLRVDCDRVRAASGSGRLVDELVGLRGLFGDDVNGVLKNFALTGGHGLQGMPRGALTPPMVSVARAAILAHPLASAWTFENYSMGNGLPTGVEEAIERVRSAS